MLPFLGQFQRSEYSLVSVHTFIRHGARQTMHSIPSYSRVDISCQTRNNLDLPRFMRSFEEDMRNVAGQRLEQQKFRNFSTHPHKDHCGTADLTPLGAAQHVKNGKLFRERYLKDLQITAQNQYDKILVRSTNLPRCFQSALAFVYGFLDGLSVSSLNMEMARDNRLCVDSGDADALSCSCKVIEAHVDAQAATYGRGEEGEEIGKLRMKLASSISRVSLVFQ